MRVVDMHCHAGLDWFEPSMDVKIGGLGERARRPKTLGRRFAVEDYPPFLEQTPAAFGADRYSHGVAAKVLSATATRVFEC